MHRTRLRSPVCGWQARPGCGHRRDHRARAFPALEGAVSTPPEQSRNARHCQAARAPRRARRLPLRGATAKTALPSRRDVSRLRAAPPKPNDAGPCFYAAGPDAPRFAALKDFGLDIRVLGGPMSTAWALKMSYAGITKGTQALGAAMLLAATRGGTADALFAELQGSQPQMLAWLKRNLALMPPKAYRWVAEMHEIAEFVGEDPSAHELYLGAAHFYERIARDFESDKTAVAALEAFLSKGAAS